MRVKHSAEGKGLFFHLFFFHFFPAEISQQLLWQADVSSGLVRSHKGQFCPTVWPVNAVACAASDVVYQEQAGPGGSWRRPGASLGTCPHVWRAFRHFRGARLTSWNRPAGAAVSRARHQTHPSDLAFQVKVWPDLLGPPRSILECLHMGGESTSGQVFRVSIIHGWTSPPQKRNVSDHPPAFESSDGTPLTRPHPRWSIFALNRLWHRPPVPRLGRCVRLQTAGQMFRNSVLMLFPQLVIMRWSKGLKSLKISLGARGFCEFACSPICTPASSHRTNTCTGGGWIGYFNLALGVNACLSLRVSPVMSWGLVQGVPPPLSPKAAGTGSFMTASCWWSQFKLFS